MLSISEVYNGKILKKYDSLWDLVEKGARTYESHCNSAKWYMENIGAGATFEKNLQLVELENGKRVWWADIVDNEFEEKVADWIFDEDGNTLLCYPDPSEFDNILEIIDESHGWNKWHEPPPKIQINANKKNELIIKIPEKIKKELQLTKDCKASIWRKGNKIMLEV